MAKRPPRVPPPTPDLAQSEWGGTDNREVLDYDAETETYYASFKSGRETLPEAIITVVAAVSETPPLELPPLEAAIDADAVERLVESSATGPVNGDVHVSFTYADCDVTVHSYGIIAVHLRHEDSPS